MLNWYCNYDTFIVIYLDLERDTTFRMNLYYIQNMEEKRNIFFKVEWWGKFQTRSPLNGPCPQISDIVPNVFISILWYQLFIPYQGQSPYDLAKQKKSKWILMQMDLMAMDKGKGKPVFLQALTRDKVHLGLYNGGALVRCNEDLWGIRSFGILPFWVIIIIGVVTSSMKPLGGALPGEWWGRGVSGVLAFFHFES